MKSSLAKNRLIADSLKQLGQALTACPPSPHRSNRLVFLCGANRSSGQPSFRREALKRFIESSSTDSRVIYAEPVFNELIRIDQPPRRNALDLEHEISLLADKIIIVLESESAFCELGAFAHKSLRDKLIVINDENFRGSASFINTGPIAALEDIKSPVLWYPMTKNIQESVDGIGATFAALSKVLSERKATVPLILPNLPPTKESLYFIHDLIHLSGPILYKELIEVLITMFGHHKFDVVSGLVGVLRAAGLIAAVAPSGAYRSVHTSTFLKYRKGFDTLLARIRHFHLRNNPERFTLGFSTNKDRGGSSDSPRPVDRRTRQRA